ncbi:hypothetical protein RI367_004943 [Sorochytrium milnesiophthora]
MDKLLRYSKDTLEYRLAKDKIDLMRVKLVSLANSFIRVRDFQPFTPGGFAALRILHSQYLDDVESFFHNSTKPEETYYEKIMPFIQTYTVSGFSTERIANTGIECLRKVKLYTEQYRSGPLKKVEQFIKDAINSYITALQTSIDKIDGDRSETNSFLGQYYQD